MKVSQLPIEPAVNSAATKLPMRMSTSSPPTDTSGSITDCVMVSAIGTTMPISSSVGFWIVPMASQRKSMPGSPVRSRSAACCSRQSLSICGSWSFISACCRLFSSSMILYESICWARRSGVEELYAL